VSREASNLILSNFGTALGAGTKAAGSVKVNVLYSRSYIISSGFTFTAVSGASFVTTASYTFSPDPVDGEEQLNTCDGGYYFILPVEAEEAGTTYNIAKSTALSITSNLYGFVAASAYFAFSGGTDSESVASVLARLPASLSHRGLTSCTAIEAQLRAELTDTDIVLQALSVQGYGAPAQHRDRHNVLGISVGGRADVYVRTFTGPSVLLLTKTGTRVSDGTYSFNITADDAPGFCTIHRIADPGDDGSSGALGSYEFTESRGASGLETTWHDIDVDSNYVETHGTVYQTSTVTLTEVPDSAATREFSVEVFTTPGIAYIQNFMDSPIRARNVAADFLVRSPLVCLVTLTANVICTPGTSSASASEVAAELCTQATAYINSRSFCGRLTRSELVKVLMANSSVSHVDMSAQGMKITGTVVDALGVSHTLSGDAIDISAIRDPESLLTAETCVFMADPDGIQIQGLL